jgi:hypothetical protein
MSRYGRYEVIHELGRGAMAAVFQARDPVLTRFVAVKVLHKDVATGGATVLQRFFNEAKTVANLRNPHVVEVFDFGKQGKEYYLVMEFVDGQSLHGLLKQLRPRGDAEVAGATEPLDPLLTASLVCQAAEGLMVAAQRNVVHRDIKPENLMINTQGYLKVADFGIAHLQDDNLTRTGAVLGSPLYMSPEQVRGVKAITSQSDMFSLGAVLYRCLAGHPPFYSPNLTELFRKIAKEPHVPLWHLRPDLDPTLLQLSEILLNKDPAERGGGPRWLRGELRNLLMGRGIADPMELVGAHLQELSARGIQTTWKGDVVLGLPRTVVKSRHRTEAAPATERATSARGATLRNSSRRQWLRPALFFLVLAAGAGTLAYFKLLPPSFLAALSGNNPAHVAASGKAPVPSVLPKAPSPAENRPYVPDAELSEILSAKIPSPAHAAAPGPAVSASASAVTAAVPAVTAELQVQSSPPFAEIYFDGQFVGIAPVSLTALSIGAHRLLIKGQSTEPLDTEISVPKGKSQMRFKLEVRDVALDGED